MSRYRMNSNLSSYSIALCFSILCTKRFDSRFICLRNSLKVVFLSLGVCFNAVPEFEKFVRIVQFPGRFSRF